MRYFGGFLASKFQKYEDLGANVKLDDNSWIGEICREEGKLMAPSCEFYKELRMMEKLFVCYHGEKSLKPGEKSMKTLTSLISRYVNLPKEIVYYFVKG